MLPHAQPVPEVDAVLVLCVLVAGVEHGPVDRADVAGREDADGLLVVVQGQADLLEVVDALRRAGPPRGRPARPAASSAIRTAMIAMTTSSSMSVKPLISVLNRFACMDISPAGINKKLRYEKSSVVNTA